MDPADLAREARLVLDRLEATEARLAEKELQISALVNTLTGLEQSTQDLMDIREDDEGTLADLRDELEQAGYSDAELMEEMDNVLAISLVHDGAEVEID